MMMWLNPDLKIYNTQIYLLGDCEGMRTGMTCQATVIVERYSDVVYVPVQAVLRVGRVPTVYVLKGDQQVEPRNVEIGLDNNSMVRIISGLTAGEKVLLAPPLASGTAPPAGKVPKKPGASKQHGERQQPGKRKQPAKPTKGGAKGKSSKPPEKRGGRK